MYKQVWVSEVLQPISFTFLTGTAFQALYWPEENWASGAKIAIVNALFTAPVALKTTDFMIVALAMCHQIQWPSWSFGYFFVDGNTGKTNYLPIGVIEDAIFLGSNHWYTSGEVTESAGSDYYGIKAASSEAHQLTWIQQTVEGWIDVYLSQLKKIGAIVPDPDSVAVNWEWLNSVGFLNFTGQSLPASKYGSPVQLSRVLVDQANDRLIRPYYSGIPIVKVYELASGNFVHDIHVSGDPEQIFAENENHAYVYCRNGILDLIDYMQGVVLSAHRAPVPPDTEFIGVGDGQQKFAYERRYRRLLSMVATSEERANGLEYSTTRIRGYYPVPLPFRLTRPIPLKPPRKNRKIPVLVRITGDILEPISSVNVSGAISGTGVLTITHGVTNEYGEVVLAAVGDTAAIATVTATATIADNEAI